MWLQRRAAGVGRAGARLRRLQTHNIHQHMVQLNCWLSNRCSGERLAWAEEVLVARSALEDRRQRLADLEAQVSSRLPTYSAPMLPIVRMSHVGLCAQ